MKKAIIEEVKDKIRSLQDERQKELEEIQARIDEEVTKARAAAAAIEKAVDALDVDAHMQAKEAEARAKTAIDMYRARQEKISKRKYITEEESDRVIDSLVEYEKELAEEYKKELAGILSTLDAATKKYQNAVTDAESTISAWTLTIHANYRNPATTYPDGTHRAPQAQPVRFSPRECAESNITAKYINDVRSVKHP